MEYLKISTAGYLIRMATEIEEIGEKFYRVLSKRFSKNPELCKLFLDLAKEEISHKNLFKKFIKPENDDQCTGINHTGYLKYLKSYSEKLMFSDESLKDEIARIKDIQGAIDFAISREYDTISFYRGIKLLLPKENRNIVHKLIDEEIEHIHKLKRVLIISR